MPKDQNDTQTSSNTAPQTSTPINPLTNVLNPANNFMGNNSLQFVPRIARMRIVSNPRYRIQATFRPEAKELMNELGKCTQSAIKDCYSQRTFTQAAYESNMQKYLVNPKITAVSYGTIEKIDQFGNPWEEWMDAPSPTELMPTATASSTEGTGGAGPSEVYGPPKPPEHFIRAITPEGERQSEQHKKEWEASGYADKSSIEKAILFSKMPQMEREALPVTVYDKMLLCYEKEISIAKNRLKNDEYRINAFVAARSWYNSILLGIPRLINYFKHDHVEDQAILLESEYKVAADVGEGLSILMSYSMFTVAQGAGGTEKVQIPQKAQDVASQIKAKNGTPPQGYRGGKVYQNTPKGSAQKLPDGINYKEYDINPYIKGQDRGVERIVIGDDGSVWYTNNHYETFTKIE